MFIERGWERVYLRYDAPGAAMCSGVALRAYAALSSHGIHWNELKNQQNKLRIAPR